MALALSQDVRSAEVVYSVVLANMVQIGFVVDRSCRGNLPSSSIEYLYSGMSFTSGDHYAEAQPCPKKFPHHSELVEAVQAWTDERLEDCCCIALEDEESPNISAPQWSFETPI